MLTFKEGGGVVNTLINTLPFEAHIPGGYQYCGPGTKLQERLRRGDPGINPLDKACKEHDTAYAQSSDLPSRHRADKILQESSWSRVKAKDAKLGEKAAAWMVTNIMKAKRKFGMGLNRRKRGSVTSSFKKILLAPLKNNLKKLKPSNIKQGAKLSLSAAKAAVKHAGGKGKIKTPRVIPLPKSGGFLPLIPLFAGLSALGALAGGASGIAKAVNASKDAQQELKEAQRHNKSLEAIALGKKGSGLYLKPYRKGLGLYLKPYSKNY